MAKPDVQIFFNFRSPYCYLASRSMFATLAKFDIEIDWRPLAAWDGRSAPERAKSKLPIARQDVSRWCKRLDIPFCPPPVTTDPTNAALVSLAAETAGQLEAFVIAVMEQEWSHGRDIGEIEVLEAVGEKIGLDQGTVVAAINSDKHRAKLEANWSAAQARGVFGVPSFVVDEEIFWGNDRLDFLAEHLATLGVARDAAA